MERISEDELAYHARLIAEMKAAQAAWQSWSAHLSAEYELHEGEGIGEDGTIYRVPLAKDAPQPEG